MAVAVVHGGKTVYVKGFGVREVGKDDKVDADTVFQLASLSKSVAASVVAHQVGTGSLRSTGWRHARTAEDGFRGPARRLRPSRSRVWRAGGPC
jgi:CubicO group peptidase (beta-lactamase class C family)